MASWVHNEPEALAPPRAVGRTVTVPATPALWEAVDALIDRATRISDLAFHRLHLLAARRYRETNKLVPRDLREQERSAAIAVLLAPVVLQKVREAYDRTIVLMKGPEIAACYPDPARRPLGDLDLLVPDAEEAHRMLRAAGFVPVGSPEPYVGIHHLQPLEWPGIQLPVEVHDRPKWVEGLPAPSRAELLATAVPGSSGVDGVLALRPDLHAVAITAHAWAHSPIAKIGHLLDVAAVAGELDRRELEQTAARLGMERVWRTTMAAADSLFDGARRPWPLRLWARNLGAVRERTVIESHLARWLPHWWALSARDALRANAFTMSRELRPIGGEPWRSKLRRTAKAIRHATRRLSDHHRALGGEGR
jgi:Uncharacterised nucleotidyltransferase